MLHGLMFDDQTQRNGYTWVVDGSGMTSKELMFMDNAYIQVCASIDELTMVGLPVICNKVMHINMPKAWASLFRFCKLIFPKSMRDCAYRVQKLLDGWFPRAECLVCCTCSV
jgi:hypothetical protein